MMETEIKFLIPGQDAVDVVLNIVAESQCPEPLKVLKLGDRQAVDLP